MNADRIEAYLKKNLSLKRYRHSVSTGNTAKALCLHHGLNENHGYIAGLCHDIGREIHENKMISLARKEYTLEEWEMAKPKLLHGKAGAVILKRTFNIDSTEILNAVAFHTLGHPLISPIGKVLYISDYIEPNRKYHSPSFYQQIFKQNLNEAFLSVLDVKINYIGKKEKNIAPPTMRLYEIVKENRCLN